MRLFTTTGLPSRDHAAAIVTGSMAFGSLWMVVRNKEFSDMSLAIQMISLGSVCLLRSAIVLRGSPGSAKTTLTHAGWLGVLNLLLVISFRLMMIRGLLPMSRLMERLSSQGNSAKVAGASLPMAMIEQGYACQVLSEWVIVILAATHALCSWRSLGAFSNAVIPQFISIVIIPWLARRAVRHYTTLPRSDIKAQDQHTKHAMLGEQSAMLSKACSSDCDLDQALQDSASCVFNDDVKQALKPRKYTSRHQNRHQVAIKLNTPLKPSDLPHGATHKLSQAIQEASLRNGHNFKVVSAGIRQGCILLSAEVLMPRDNHQNDGCQQPCLDVMQLAQSLVPDLLSRLGLDGHPTAGVDSISLQVGQQGRVIASWHPQKQTWAFKHEPAAWGLLSGPPHSTPDALTLQHTTPMLGLVRCMDHLSAYTGGISDSQTAARSSGYGLNHLTHLTQVNEQHKSTSSSAAAEPAGSYTNNTNQETANDTSSETACQVCFKVQVEVLTAGSHFLVQGHKCSMQHGDGSHSNAKRHLPTVEQCRAADGSHILHLVAYGTNGYGDTYVLQTSTPTTTGPCAAKIIQVEVRLPAASLARHHEGGPCAALQPLTLQLWAGDAWVSTTYCVLPLADATQFGWWGNIPASVAVAAAEELQAANESLFTTSYNLPPSPAEEGALNQPEPQREGMQDLLHDVSCWLASIAVASHNSGHCMANVHTAACETNSIQPAGLQPFVHRAGLSHADDMLQLQADLLQFAKAAGCPALQSLLETSISKAAVTWPSFMRFKGATGSSSSTTHEPVAHGRVFEWMWALRAATVGAACTQCEALYEQRLHNSLGAVYWTMSVLMGIAGLVGVFNEGASAFVTAVLVALWGTFHIILGSLQLSGMTSSRTVFKQLHLIVFSLRFLANFLITIGAASMLPSVARQHQRFTWVSVYLGCSLAERSPLTGVWPTWFTTIITTVEGCMLYTVTCAQYPVWWRAFWSFACTLGIPLLLDAHLRAWLLCSPKQRVLQTNHAKLHCH